MVKPKKANTKPARKKAVPPKGSVVQTVNIKINDTVKRRAAPRRRAPAAQPAAQALSAMDVFRGGSGGGGGGGSSSTVVSIPSQPSNSMADFERMFSMMNLMYNQKTQSTEQRAVEAITVPAAVQAAAAVNAQTSPIQTQATPWSDSTMMTDLPPTNKSDPPSGPPLRPNAEYMSVDANTSTGSASTQVSSAKPRKLSFDGSLFEEMFGESYSPNDSTPSRRAPQRAFSVEEIDTSSEIVPYKATRKRPAPMSHPESLTSSQYTEVIPGKTTQSPPMYDDDGNEFLYKPFEPAFTKGYVFPRSYRELQNLRIDPKSETYNLIRQNMIQYLKNEGAYSHRTKASKSTGLQKDLTTERLFAKVKQLKDSRQKAAEDLGVYEGMVETVLDGSRTMLSPAKKEIARKTPKRKQVTKKAKI